MIQRMYGSIFPVSKENRWKNISFEILPLCSLDLILTKFDTSLELQGLSFYSVDDSSFLNVLN